MDVPAMAKVVWRNYHAYDERLSRVVGRANVA